VLAAIARALPDGIVLDLRPNAVVVDSPHVLARRQECVMVCGAAVVLDLCFAAMTVSPTTIVRRRVQIDFGTVPPGPWFPAGGWIEVVFNAASISFPLAERFGIDALRDSRGRIEDPELLKQIGGFLHQEAMHDRVHTACNDMLARHNPRCIRAERVSAGVFRLLSRTPLAFRLSVSAGMEHVAALLAEVVLQHDKELHDVLPAPVADLWVWHAVEETEHKAVCFDVHAAAVGTGFLAYVNRVFGMLIATPLFLLVMLGIGAAVQGSPRPAPVKPSAPAADARPPDRFTGRNILGVLRAAIPWRQYFSYYRPSFHPWEHDNSHLVTDWKARYPHFGSSPNASASTDRVPDPQLSASPARA
jgi:predicted metal-dependent hydrolase